MIFNGDLHVIFKPFLVTKIRLRENSMYEWLIRSLTKGWLSLTGLHMRELFCFFSVHCGLQDPHCSKYSIHKTIIKLFSGFDGALDATTYEKLKVYVCIRQLISNFSPTTNQKTLANIYTAAFILVSTKIATWNIIGWMSHDHNCILNLVPVSRSSNQRMPSHSSSMRQRLKGRR